jgi:hypothetical protein
MDLIWAYWRDPLIQCGLASSGGLIIVVACATGTARCRIVLLTLVFAWPAAKSMMIMDGAEGWAFMNAAVLLPAAFALSVVGGRHLFRVGVGTLAVLALAATHCAGWRAIEENLRPGWPPALSRWSGGVLLSSNHLAALAVIRGVCRGGASAVSPGRRRCARSVADSVACGFPGRVRRSIAYDFSRRLSGADRRPRLGMLAQHKQPS